MARALSMDLRRRILAARDRGATIRELSLRFQVTERTIYAWLRQRRETGSVEPRQGRVGRKPRLDDRKQEILQTIDQHPSLTLKDLRTLLSLPISLPALWRTLRRWGIRLKKSDSRRRTTTARCA